jgi:hypothetical protein
VIETMIETRCAKSISGCAECAAEEAYALAHEHSCGVSTAELDSFCEVVGEARRSDEKLHQLMHRPQLCETCGAVLDDHRGVTGWRIQSCPTGQCDQIVCVACGEVDSSFGDVYCRTCGSFGYLPHVSRMHRLYRQRRRGRW